MKHYRVTAFTMYVGEETTDYIATDSEELLRDFGLNLSEENALEWEPCWVDYVDHGYDSEEDWQEEYFGSAGYRFEEISEEEYKKEIAAVWPFELVKEGPGWNE